MTQNGKGDRFRVDSGSEKFLSSYERIFGKPIQKPAFSSSDGELKPNGPRSPELGEDIEESSAGG
jgi:hypothetical protein